MIKDLKFAFRCMKFAHNKKMMTILSLFFLIFGVVNFALGERSSYLTGGYMLLLAPTMYCQMFQSVNMSNLVLSSPKKKFLGIRVLTILNSFCIFVGFVFFSIAVFIVYKLDRCPIEDISYLYIVQGIIGVIVLTYMAFSYKKYILSSAIFIVCFFAAFIMMNSLGFFKDITIPVYAGAGICFGCLMIGCFVFYLVSKLVYRTPMDKHAMQSQLRMDM